MKERTSFDNQASLRIMNKLSNINVNLLHKYSANNFETIESGFAFDFVYLDQIYKARITEGDFGKYRISFVAPHLNCKSLDIASSIDNLHSDFETLTGQIKHFL